MISPIGRRVGGKGKPMRVSYRCSNIGRSIQNHRAIFAAGFHHKPKNIDHHRHRFQTKEIREWENKKQKIVAGK